MKILVEYGFTGDLLNNNGYINVDIYIYIMRMQWHKWNIMGTKYD
jgi:hypothetical protein